MKQKLVIGITQGDSNGIGYEVIIKALSNASVLDMFTPVVYGSSKAFGFYRKQIPDTENINTNLISSAKDAHPKRVNIVNCVGDDLLIEPGKLTHESAKAAIASLEMAVEEAKAGYIDVIVTAPFSKKGVTLEHFKYAGHTGYLIETFGAEDGLMFMCSESLRVGVVTMHVPLKEVSSLINKEVIMSKLKLMNDSLKQDFYIERPKIAVLGLNPHAGDRGLLGEEEPWISRRPFRNPGHAITQVGLFGGGMDPKPGEISLAHKGVLFLDEFTEDRRKEILEMLRIPLEDHKIMIVRNERTITYPADFLLIAASNPCPCGYYPDPGRCRCTLRQITNHQSRLSGPILDRMDLFVRCEEIDYKTMTTDREESTSDSIRNKVMEAWRRQKQRAEGRTEYFNGRMTGLDIGRYCRLSSKDNKLLEKAYDTYRMSGRSLNRVLKVARTIADLDGSESIRTEHLEEALLYRRMRPGSGDWI